MARTEGGFHVACISFLCDRARPGAPVHSKRMGSGAVAHGDGGGLLVPTVKVPLVRASLVCPSSATGSSVLAEQVCYVMATSVSPLVQLTHQHFFRRTAPSSSRGVVRRKKCGTPRGPASSLSYRRHGPRQRLRVYARGSRPSGQSWRPGSPAPWPCRISSPCA
jgi:hypothetical protein